ncbi:MAG: DUF2254 domain-containing protein [Pirellulaceae bacterium]
MNSWDAIRSSFWFLPSVLSLCALLLALACTVMDGPFERWVVDQIPWVGVSTDAARASLGAIVSAMVSIAGIVFSVMLVTLSITASQYGSRLLRTFTSDVVTQLSLGTLIATSLYCLVALAGIRDDGGQGTANVSVVVGLCLAIFSLGVLIAFIHHVSNLIQAPSVVAAVAADLDQSLNVLFPAASRATISACAIDEHIYCQLKEGAPIKSTKEGYIQTIDLEGLVNFAVDADLLIQLRVRPGHFVENGQAVAELWPCDALPNVSTRNESGVGERAIEFGRRFDQRFNGYLAVGNRRTPRQDAECALEELVEVAVRALSPGINDPFTAIACVDRLSAALGRVAERSDPNEIICDNTGSPRLKTTSTTFASLMDAAFNQLRQHGCSSVAVAIRLVECFQRISQHVSDGDRRDVVCQHAHKLRRDFRRQVSEPDDGDDFQEAWERLLEELGPPPSRDRLRPAS